MKRGYTIKKLSILIALVLFSVSMLHAQNEAFKGFQDFPWGTSLRDFKAKMGEPVHVEENNGLQSLIYENVRVSGYPAFMLAYFSKDGLEGGTYYFDTASVEELMRCYTDIQKELSAVYGPTLLYETLLREMRTYETSWDLPGGYVYLKINTRWLNEPVTLWYSSPSLTKQLRGS